MFSCRVDEMMRDLQDDIIWKNEVLVSFLLLEVARLYIVFLLFKCIFIVVFSCQISLEVIQLLNSPLLMFKLRSII